jgi:hypothetical protein
LTPCDYGPEAEKQVECEDYEPEDSDSVIPNCFKFRDLNGLFHCDCLGDRTKNKPQPKEGT